jgi:D-alanyl-D-alanine carboxypeptidase
MSASVYLPGQGTWQGVSGISYTGQPITPNMEFGIASNSKLFVATAMLILAENRIISLDDSIHKWLPKYQNVNPNITIRQLLNHTSGISDPITVSPWVDTIKANPTRVFTPNEVLGWLSAPLFAAGTRWGYSNVNYVLAGMIAESATGFHISKIIRDSILTPLQLDSTYYDGQEPEVGTVSHRWWNTIDYHDTSRIGLNAAGGAAGAIFSNSSEMAQWYHALFSGQVINQSSVIELTAFVATGNPAYAYGLGLSHETTQGLTYWGHGGSTWGYKSKMMYDTCMGTVVCGLANSFPAGMDGIVFLLFRTVKNHVPGCPGAITGPTVVRQGQNNMTYTTTPITNATTYVWTLPGGATGASTTNSITVHYGMTAVSGDVTVRGDNAYGVGNTSSLHVTVNTSTGFAESLAENKETIVYPNPFSVQTTLQTDYVLNNATLTVDNIFGQKVLLIKNISGQKVVFKRDNLAAGLYFARLTQDNHVIATVKLVITD